MKKVADFQRKVQGQKPLNDLKRASWILGIDIGKQKLSCALLSRDEVFLCRFDIEASPTGFQVMLERVASETRGAGSVVYALEPTSHYWMVLGQFLEDNNKSYVLVHPLVVARSREVKRLNRGKTDAFDARLIAELACRGNVTRTQIPEDDWATIRFYAREYFDREKDVAREKLRIMSYLETSLPGFLEVFPKPTAETSRACLRTLVNFRNVLQGEYARFENQVRTHYSVWGTSPLTNALVLGFMGDPSSYDSPSSLVKMAGCEPVPHESGKFKGRSFISHRGRNLLRKAGDRIAFLLEKRNSVFRNFFRHLTTRSQNKLTKRETRVACINKYFRIIWVLCNHRVPFNPALA